MDLPNASHFIFIPSVLIVGVVIGWFLGSRAAQDAFASEQRKREERRTKNKEQRTKNEEPTDDRPAPTGI